jgi:hypothetical protein
LTISWGSSLLELGLGNLFISCWDSNIYFN